MLPSGEKQLRVREQLIRNAQVQRIDKCMPVRHTWVIFIQKLVHQIAVAVRQIKNVERKSKVTAFIVQQGLRKCKIKIVPIVLYLVHLPPQTLRARAAPELTLAYSHM